MLFVTLFSGTWHKTSEGRYDLAGNFSGTSNGVRYSGVTNQQFKLNFEDGRVSLSGLAGKTTIIAAPVRQLSFFCPVSRSPVRRNV